MSRVHPVCKSLYAAYIEQAVPGGKISPPSGIFLMKNWLNYRDTISLEENMPRKDTKRVLPADAPIDLLAWKNKDSAPKDSLTLPCLEDTEAETGAD